MADLQNPTMQHQVMPDDGITLTIVLTDDGDAEVHLRGDTQMPCWCGISHFYVVEATLLCGSAMEPLDMNDLDAAIRGELSAARRLGWRLMHRLFFYETPPCERED